MNAKLSFAPLFRNSVGFDRFGDLFETMLSDPENRGLYPPCDITKTGEYDYSLALAVPGYAESDLDIEFENGRLTVRGKAAEHEEDGVRVLHRGIPRRDFERVFSLADHMQVTGASLADGLLTITLVQEIPEEMKPRRIAITETNTKSVTHEHAPIENANAA